MKSFKFLNKNIKREWDLYERKVLNMLRYHYRPGTTNVIGDVYNFNDDQNRVIRINDMFNIGGVYYIDYIVTIYHTHTSQYRLRIEYSDLENILRQDADL